MASWALAATVATACAKFSGAEPPADASVVPLDGSAVDAAAPPRDAASGDAVAEPPRLCPDGSHTFCDSFDTAAALDARWSAVVGAEHLSFVSSNAVSQPNALRVAGQRVGPNALARAEARLPTPSKAIRCQAQIRADSVSAEGSLPLALDLAGPTGNLLFLVFFFPGAFELGVERGTSNASPTYANVYKTQPLPQLTSVTKTTIEISLVTKSVRLAFGDMTVASLDLDVPPEITSAKLSIGDLRVNGSTGTAVDTSFDDLFCDVDL